MKKFCFLNVIFVLFLMSCENITTDVNSTSFTQDIAGNVKLYDLNGLSGPTNKVLPDLSGVKISVDNTDIIAISDANGNWSIQDVPIKSENSNSGYIVLRYDKEGFATHKERYSIKKQDETKLIASQSLYLLPEFYPDSLSYKMKGALIEFSGIFKTDNPQLTKIWKSVTKQVNVFSSKSTFSNDLNNYQFYYNGSNDYSEVKITLSLSTLYNQGYKSGDKVYFIVASTFFSSFSYNYYYENGYDGRKIFSLYNKRLSNEVTFVLP